MDTPWLNNCNGAISLSFDDGSQAQLDIAIPILDVEVGRTTVQRVVEGLIWEYADWRLRGIDVLVPCPGSALSGG